MNRAALMTRIEQHFGAKAMTRGADLAALLEDICCQVYQWAQEDSLAANRQAVEPAAWAYEYRQPHTDPVIWAEFFSRTKPSEDSTWVRNIQPLHDAKPVQQPHDDRKPDGWAYRYSSPLGDVIRHNYGQEVNGVTPIEAIPFFYGAALLVDPPVSLNIAGHCEVCAGTGTAFGKTCNCTKGASHG